MASNNGKLKANRRAAMRGYRAGIRSSGLWLQDADHPVFLTYQEIDRMMLDEQVYLGYEMLYAPICTVKIQCQCKDERVKKFVERQFHRFWLHDLFKAFRMIVYGHAGGEVVLEQMGKYLEFSSFVEAHPQDIAPLIHEETGGLWGVRVSGAGMPKTAFLKSPYALWFINEQQFSSWYGRTRLKSVWYAWNEKRGGGAKSASGARKLWFVKNAFDGGMLWYPSKDSFQDPDTGEVINAQDFAMEILEQKETGGVLALPSDVDETGNKKWSYEPPKVNGQIDGVLDWGDKLDLAILKGWGIPPEVIQASGEPGGGFAGRALPALMFYKREDGLVDSIVYPFDKQVVRHLVRHNFGKVDYEIEPTSLVPKEEPGGQEQPPGTGVPPGQTPGGGGGGGFQDLLGSMSDTAQFSLGNVGSIQMGWDKYDGKRGGQGWRDSETGEIRYQEEKPSDSDSKPYEVQESDFVDGVHQVQESDLVKDGQWTKKAIKIGKTILQLSNAVPTATSLLVREAGYSEPVQKVALAIATIGDWSVPGLPVGSALITALTLASSPTLPFKLMKKASKAVSEQIKRMRQKQVKLGLATPNNETILAVGNWLNSAEDFNQALAIFAEALNQTNDVTKALAVAKEVGKTVRLGWEPYEGPKGGKGWHNTETLEVRYQEEKPGGIFEKDEEEEVKKDIRPDADFFDEGGTRFYTKTSNPKEYAARLTDLRKNNVLKRIAKKLQYIEMLAEELTEERDKDVDYSGDIEDTVGTLENIGKHISSQLSSIVEAHQKNILEAYKNDKSIFPEEVDTWFEEINDKWNEEIQSTIDMIISAIENQDENTGEHAAYWIEKLNEEIESAFNEISDESYAIVESIEGAIDDAVSDHEIDAQNYTEYLSEESEDPDAEAEKFNREAANNPYQMNRVWFDEEEGEWVYSDMDDLWDDEIDYPGKEADKKNRSVQLSLLGQLAKEFLRLSWEPYNGPRGGTGWINTETQDIAYQEEKPGADHIGKSAQPNDKAKKITSDKIRYLNEQSEDPDAEAEEFNSKAESNGIPYRVLFNEDEGEWVYKSVSSSSNKKPSKVSKDDLDFIKDYGAGSLDMFATDTRDAFENTDMLDDFENLQELEDYLDWVKNGLWTIGRDNDDIESVLEIADDYGVDRSDIEKVFTDAEKPIIANIDKLKSMIKDGVKPIPWGPNHPEYFELPAKPKLPNGVPNPPNEDEYLTEEAYDDDFDEWLDSLPDGFSYEDYQKQIEQYESDLYYWNKKKEEAELFAEDDENIKKFWAIKDALVDSLDQAADRLPRKIINIFKNQLAKKK